MEEPNQLEDMNQRDRQASIDDIVGGGSDVENGSDDEEYPLGDEDGQRLNEDTLLRLKSSDPSVTSIAVHRFDHCIDGKDAGHFIGDNAHLKKLVVKGEFMEWDEDYLKTMFLFGRFCKGLAQNRSLEDLSISFCELSVGHVPANARPTNPNLTKLRQVTAIRLAHFCQQNINLQSLKIDCCDLEDKSTRVLAMFLAKKSDKSALRRVNLFANKIGDIAAQELIESLDGYDGLVELSLGNNQVGARGCAAIEKLLSRPKSNLRELNLENNAIDDNGITTLTRSVAGSTTLKEVDLGFNMDITPAGWQQFFTCLQNPSSSIEQLSIGSNNITDNIVCDLGNALASNSTLKVLDFNANYNREQAAQITAAGWQSFFACLQNSKSALQDIHLRGCAIDEKGLAVVSDALSKNPTFKLLDLSDNHQGNTSAWRHFFTSCLQSPNSSLEGLFLCSNFAQDADDLMADLALAVASNETLDAIDLGENPTITNIGWSHFSHRLCDKSSIANICASNHTLNYLGPQRLPQDLENLMYLNIHENKKEVMREKLIQYHFEDGANMQEMQNIKLQVLPHAISWLGKDSSWTGRGDTGHTPLYQLLRNAPSLLAPKNTALAGAKRKRAT